MVTTVSQYLDVFLSLAFSIALFRLKLQTKYLAILVFILSDSLASIVFIVCRWMVQDRLISIDYRALWCVMTWIGWVTTIWLVYVVLIAILERLPGIRQFSLRLMAVAVAISFATAFFTINPEYASSVGKAGPMLDRLTALTAVVDRALSLAELLTILAILAFVLRFPIRVPRNLATFSSGLACFLFLRIGFFLLRTYVPSVHLSRGFGSIPGYLIAGCLVYWIFFIDAAGEEAQATLGRAWQSVPKEHLVHQLEAMNAALLRSREQV